MEQNRRRLAWASMLLMGFFMSPVAKAFSVKIHIFYANLIHENLKENFAKTGKYEVDLIRPDGKGHYKLTLKPEDAKAILEKPEYFRGGATGPDNTAFSGLTDPSHAAGTFPFQQCRGLLQAATEKARNDVKSPRFAKLSATDKAAVTSRHKEERAYALGCFLHGITDNVAHHIVNFFSQQTFTLTPVMRAARTPDFLKPMLNQDRLVTECNAKDSYGALIRGLKTCEGLDNNKSMAQDFTNVVKHILVESNFEHAVIESFGGMNSKAFSPSALEHKLAMRLYRQAYLSPNDAHYNMRTMMGPVIAQQDQFIAEYLGKNVDKRPQTITDDRGNTESREDFDSIDIDTRRLDAIAEFLNTGGSVVGVDESGSLAPFQYVLLLPELIERLQFVLTQIESKVKDKAMNQCGGLSNLRPSCRLAKWLVEPYTHNGVKYKGGRIQYLVHSRKSALGHVLDAHVHSIQNLSNLLVKKPKSGLTQADLMNVFKPLDEAVMKLSDTPAEFFPLWARLFGIPEFFSTFTQKVKTKIVMFIRGKIEEHLLKLHEELKLMMGPAYEEYKAEVEELKKKIIAAIEHGKKTAMTHVNERAVVEAGYVGEKFGMLQQFPMTVAHMNAYNSIAAVLADINVVAADESVYPQARHIFAGPVSFDASYQIEYNQMALCPSLREIFYPCGTTVSEMLQPAGYARCQTIPEIDPESEPEIECHAGSKFLYAMNPTKETCKPVSADDFNSRTSNFVGSVSLSFPPHLARTQPTCLGVKLPVRAVTE